MPINPRNPDALTFARALGAEHIAALDLELGPRRIECHRIDYGPGGLLAAQRAVVYGELGLAPPGVGEGEHTARARGRSRGTAQLPRSRTSSPAARSRRATTPEERVESVRALLRDAAEHAFGDNENEKLLQRVLIRGYIEPAPSHEQAAIDLSLSRAAYFRRLRAAAERVAEYLAGLGVGGGCRVVGGGWAGSQLVSASTLTATRSADSSSMAPCGGGASRCRSGRSASANATSAATTWTASTTAAKPRGFFGRLQQHDRLGDRDRRDRHQEPGPL